MEESHQEEKKRFGFYWVNPKYNLIKASRNWPEDLEAKQLTDPMVDYHIRHCFNLDITTPLMRLYGGNLYFLKAYNLMEQDPDKFRENFRAMPMIPNSPTLPKTLMDYCCGHPEWMIRTVCLTVDGSDMTLKVNFLRPVVYQTEVDIKEMKLAVNATHLVTVCIRRGVPASVSFEWDPIFFADDTYDMNGINIKERYIIRQGESNWAFNMKYCAQCEELPKLYHFRSHNGCPFVGNQFSEDCLGVSRFTGIRLESILKNDHVYNFFLDTHPHTRLGNIVLDDHVYEKGSGLLRNLVSCIKPVFPEQAQGSDLPPNELFAHRFIQNSWYDDQIVRHIDWDTTNVGGQSAVYKIEFRYPMFFTIYRDGEDVVVRFARELNLTYKPVDVKLKNSGYERRWILEYVDFPADKETIIQYWKGMTDNDLITQVRAVIPKLYNVNSPGWPPQIPILWGEMESYQRRQS